MSFNLNSDYKGFFQVPNTIVDKHLRFASGNQLKFLLYILKNGCDSPFDKIAKDLKMNAEDVNDCADFWVLTGVLEESGDVSAPAANPGKKNEPEKFIPSKKENEDSKPEQIQIQYSRPSQNEVLARMEESSEIANLFKELQSKLGKTIGYNGCCTFLLLLDYFGLPIEVIFMIVDYCVSIGQTGYGYIEAVGKSWAEQEINTIERAAQKIDSMGKTKAFWKEFTAVTGIKNPNPTTKQSQYIERWITEYKLPSELIVAAYETMADKTGKISFKYMDTIIESWHRKGFKSLSDVENEAKAQADAGKAKANREASYDLDKFTRDSMNRKLKYERKN